MARCSVRSSADTGNPRSSVRVPDAGFQGGVEAGDGIRIDRRHGVADRRIPVVASRVQYQDVHSW